MQLQVDSDAAYLVMPGAKSCFVGYFYLASHPHLLNYNGTPHNAPVLVEYHILKNVVCSAAKGDCGGLFHNAQSSVKICIILEALVHPQKQNLGHAISLAEGGCSQKSLGHLLGQRGK
eukprot:13882411-Ditylum_brightwellii.AAC.1